MQAFMVNAAIFFDTEQGRAECALLVGGLPVVLSPAAAKGLVTDLTDAVERVAQLNQTAEAMRAAGADVTTIGNHLQAALVQDLRAHAEAQRMAAPEPGAAPPAAKFMPA